MRELKIFAPVSALENATALDPVVDAAVGVVNGVLRSRTVRDTLHGVPVGHAVHPVAILLPVGAWLSSAILDFVPGTERASRILVGAGIVGVLPSVATGLTDWSELHEQQKRVGLVHAVTNTAATALYTASFIARRGGKRGLGAALGLAGLSLVGLSGYLGGHLAYRQAAGVNHIEDVPHRFPQGWQPLGDLHEFAERTLVTRSIAGIPLLVLRTGDDVNVLTETCSHLSGPLGEGELSEVGGEACVACPWHGSVFSMQTGEVVRGPATAPQLKFETRIADGRVEVLLPNAG